MNYSWSRLSGSALPAAHNDAWRSAAALPLAIVTDDAPLGYPLARACRLLAYAMDRVWNSGPVATLRKAIRFNV